MLACGQATGHQVDPVVGSGENQESTPSLIVDLWSGQNVSIDTFNKMHSDHNVVKVVIPCLMPNNTQEAYCPANVNSARQSNLGYFPDIVLVPNAKYANPRQQVKEALEGLNLDEISFIWIDVSYPEFWAGPVSINQQFLDVFLHELHQVSGLGWTYIGIKTFKAAWRDIMGSWNYPASKAIMLWNMLFDGKPSIESDPFGGWTAITYKQFLEKKLMCSLTVNYDFGPNYSS